MIRDSIANMFYMISEASPDGGSTGSLYKSLCAEETDEACVFVISDWPGFRFYDYLLTRLCLNQWTEVSYVNNSDLCRAIQGCGEASLVIGTIATS